MKWVKVGESGKSWGAMAFVGKNSPADEPVNK